MEDLPALVTAIGGAVAAILGGVGAVILALRRVSPTERTSAAAAPMETEREKRIAELEEALRKAREEPP